MNGKQYQLQDENIMLSTRDHTDHEDVGLVQEMLRRFGYLTVPYQRGAFKEETARAVRRRGGACWVRQIASC